jgi:exodeoxyribonuclease VII large subunit
VQIILYPAIVQGDAAPESIIRGIHALEDKADVLIVGRGGGSIEDLWAFNEESVAQAVFDCRIPVISAVGHETDTTIVDYVADLRAPTPSAAAELAVFDVSLTLQQMRERKAALNRLMRGKLEWNRIRMEAYQAKLKLHSPLGFVREQKTWLMNLEERLTDAMYGQITAKRHIMELYIEKLKGLSPLDKLNQGFSYISDEKGRTVTDIKQVEIGDSLQIYVKNGKITATVAGKESV